MKKYTYVVFLRHPETKEVQFGTVEFTVDGFLPWDQLAKLIHTSPKLKQDLEAGYTLLGLNIKDVEDSTDD